MPAPRILLVDDHPLFLEALQATLAAGFKGAEIGVADTIDGAKAHLEKHKAELILLDLKMPDAAGFEGVLDIRRRWPKTPLAIISALADDEIVRKAKTLGAEGFISKSQKRDAIVAAVKTLLDGKTSFPAIGEAASSTGRFGSDQEIMDRLRELTPQQFKVLNQICEGKLNKQIAYEFGVAETTIKAHITSIFKKLGIHSRTQAVLVIQRLISEGLSLDDEWGGGHAG